MENNYTKSNAQIPDITVPILLVFVSLCMRTLYFTSLGAVLSYADSFQYLKEAGKLLKLQFDVIRVPVYPLFILVAQNIFRGFSPEFAVFLLQCVFSSVATAILFYIASLLLNSKIKAFLVALFCSISICIINWDMLIMTESLTAFFILVLVLFIILYLKKKSVYFLVFIYGIHILLIFIRPFYLFLPAITLFILVSDAIKNKARRYEWFTHLILFFLVYACVGSYCMVNMVQNGYFGISSVSVFNSLGKVMQYRMYDLGKDEELKVKIDEYLKEDSESPLDPANFINTYRLQEDHYERISRFVGDIIREHPALYMKKTISLVVGELWKEKLFADYNNGNYTRDWPELLYEKINDIPLFNSFAMLYILGFIEFLVLLYSLFCRHYLDYRWFFIDLLVAYQFLMSIMGSYSEYQRLMAPAYILIILLVFKNLFNLVNETKKRIFHKQIAR